MFFSGETDMLWTEGIIELVRWRRHRRAQATAAACLVAEVEAYLRAEGAPPPSA